jgi:hypothetical protein
MRSKVKAHDPCIELYQNDGQMDEAFFQEGLLRLTESQAAFLSPALAGLSVALYLRYKH